MKIVDCVFENFFSFFKKSDSRVTTPAQEPANLSGFVTMINRKSKIQRIFVRFTYSTLATLRRNHVVILLKAHLPLFAKKPFSSFRFKHFWPLGFHLIVMPFASRTPRRGMSVFELIGIVAFFASRIQSALRFSTMELRRRLSLITSCTCLVVLHSLTIACSNVSIKDEIFYGNKGMLGAVEFHTFTTDQREISFEEWMTLIRTQPLICSSVDTFGDIKIAVEQLCSVCNCCTADVTKRAEDFFNNIQSAELSIKGSK